MLRNEKKEAPIRCLILNTGKPEMTSMEAEERVQNTERTNNMEAKASNLSHKKIQQNPKKQIKYNT